MILLIFQFSSTDSFPSASVRRCDVECGVLAPIWEAEIGSSFLRNSGLLHPWYRGIPIFSPRLRAFPPVSLAPGDILAYFGAFRRTWPSTSPLAVGLRSLPHRVGAM